MKRASTLFSGWKYLAQHKMLICVLTTSMLLATVAAWFVFAIVAIIKGEIFESQYRGAPVLSAGVVHVGCYYRHSSFLPNYSDGLIATHIAAIIPRLIDQGFECFCWRSLTVYVHALFQEWKRNFNTNANISTPYSTLVGVHMQHAGLRFPPNNEVTCPFIHA